MYQFYFHLYILILFSQYNYEHMYDDEYDDRDDDDVAIPVPDNPISEEIQTLNPNRQNRYRKSESEDEPSEVRSN